jgi:hypothetical protein
MSKLFIHYKQMACLDVLKIGGTINFNGSILKSYNQLNTHQKINYKGNCRLIDIKYPKSFYKRGYNDDDLINPCFFERTLLKIEYEALLCILEKLAFDCGNADLIYRSSVQKILKEESKTNWYKFAQPIKKYKERHNENYFEAHFEIGGIFFEILSKKIDKKYLGKIVKNGKVIYQKLGYSDDVTDYFLENIGKYIISF